MSRAIDADALKEQIESHVVSMSVCMSVDEHYGKVTMREECLQDIADAPTVDAVPVEWLWQAQDKMLSSSQFSFEECAIVGVLIRAWHKEQEAQNG